MVGQGSRESVKHEMPITRRLFVSQQFVFAVRCAVGNGCYVRLERFDSVVAREPLLVTKLAIG